MSLRVSSGGPVQAKVFRRVLLLNRLIQPYLRSSFATPPSFSLRRPHHEALAPLFMRLQNKNIRHHRQVDTTHPLLEISVRLGTLELIVGVFPTRDSNSTCSRPTTNQIRTTNNHLPTSHAPRTLTLRSSSHTEVRKSARASPPTADRSPAQRVTSTQAATLGRTTLLSAPHPRPPTPATPAPPTPAPHPPPKPSPTPTPTSPPPSPLSPTIPSPTNPALTNPTPSSAPHPPSPRPRLQKTNGASPPTTPHLHPHRLRTPAPHPPANSSPPPPPTLAPPLSSHRVRNRRRPPRRRGSRPRVRRTWLTGRCCPRSGRTSVPRGRRGGAKRRAGGKGRCRRRWRRGGQGRCRLSGRGWGRVMGRGLGGVRVRRRDCGWGRWMLLRWGRGIVRRRL